MARTVINKTAFLRNASRSLAADGTFQAGDAANGMMFVAGDADKILIHAKNTNGATRTLTVKAGVGGHLGMAWMGAQGDLATVIPITTGEVMIGPFESARFEQSDGYIYLDLDASAGVTLAVYQLP